jgi:hypothetical protein
LKNNALHIELSLAEKFSILWPYITDNFLAQLKSIWFIVFYLAVFQVLILELPIVYTAMISVGIFIVVMGLMFFMEGLRLGLMPLGETIGAILPSNTPLWGVLLFSFILGLGATFAEPAIAVLRSAGSGVSVEQSPLLYSLLNDFTGELVTVVGIGVGLAVLLGVLRFYRNWSLKLLVIPSVSLLALLTLIANLNPQTQAVLGLAWDCGAVTTGPVTVPLVLALGIGVCRILGNGDTSNAGFGIVTLASLFPILAVLLLSFFHYLKQDYVGAEHYQGNYPIAQEEKQITPVESRMRVNSDELFTPEEFQQYLENDLLDFDYQVEYRGGNKQLIDGEIVITDSQVVLKKVPSPLPVLMSQDTWNPTVDMAADLKNSIMSSLRAIVPLCLFLIGTLWLILFLNREQFSVTQEIKIGIIFSLIGMTLFMLGLSLGLTPLGSQLGGNIPTAFASLTPWGAEGDGLVPAKYSSETLGKSVAIIFGFFLGYGATLAEPALNALGNTVEKVTVGAFRKPLLMHSVAFGVGLGIAAGVTKIAFNLPLVYLLIPPYLLLLVLTWISSEEFVNFGWDSAGVTTGPITVPLVLAMGLGVGAAVPGVIDGFGILALASVGPIITVLSVGLIVARVKGEQ